MSASLLWILNVSLQWRHNGRDSVSNYQPHDCFWTDKSFAKWAPGQMDPMQFITENHGYFAGIFLHMAFIQLLSTKKGELWGFPCDITVSLPFTLVMLFLIVVLLYYNAFHSRYPPVIFSEPITWSQQNIHQSPKKSPHKGSIMRTLMLLWC